MEFAGLREEMVRGQLVPRGISDPRVLGAMGRVPRHLFVGEEMRHRAYDDMALQIGEGQTISQPYMVAAMTELLELKGGERVLEIGTGSGYQSAVLAELAKEVYTVERMVRLSEEAREKLDSMGYRNVSYRVGDGTLGWPEEAPFDRILVTAGAPAIPLSLEGQLGEGGILLLPVGSMYSQVLVKARKVKGSLSLEEHTPCVFVPLIGREGWSSG